MTGRKLAVFGQTLVLLDKLAFLMFGFVGFFGFMHNQISHRKRSRKKFMAGIRAVFVGYETQMPPVMPRLANMALVKLNNTQRYKNHLH